MSGDNFCDPALEAQVLREILYWGTVGGYNIIEEQKLTEEPDLFTEERHMVWQGLLYGVAQTGTIEVAHAVLSVPSGELRDKVREWITQESDYGSALIVPWDEMIGKLRTMSACRQVARATSKVSELAGSPEAVRSIAYQMCCDLEKVVLAGDKTENVGSEYDIYADVMKRGGTWITGLKQLDKHGRFGGYYSIVGARSHHGKTAVMVTMMLNQLLSGHSVFLWQGEQTKAQMYMRFVCQMTGLKSWEVLKPQSDEQHLLIRKAREKIDRWLSKPQDGPALYLYDGRRTVYDVMRLIRAARQRHPICVAYIDQLSKFARDSKMSRESAYSDMSEVLAVESLKLKQPIMLAHQLNIKERKDVAGPPSFWQVKDCGRLYEDCDVWITVDRPEADAERMVEFDKARDKAKAKGDLDTADRFDVRGRIKIKVEKDRVATYGCHEEWLGFDHACGRIFSRMYGPDPLEHAVRATQIELGIMPEEDANGEAPEAF